MDTELEVEAVVMPATIMLIPEIRSRGQGVAVGQQVRVVGTVISVDRAPRIAVLEYKKARLLVDTNLIPSSSVRLDDTLQFAGELNSFKDKVLQYRERSHWQLAYSSTIDICRKPGSMIMF
jgi:hypothetical protein